MALLHAKGQDQDLDQQQRGHVLRAGKNTLLLKMAQVDLMVFSLVMLRL